MAFKRNFLCIIVPLVFLSLLDQCVSIYPGLRRKPMTQQAPQALEMSPDYLSQLMEENARRRLQLQFEQQLELINYQIRRQREKQRQKMRERQQQKELEELNANVEDYYDQNFEDEQQQQQQQQQVKQYGFQNTNNRKFKLDLMKTKPPFAVGPSDPRFYANTEDESDSFEDDTLDQKELEQYKEILPNENVKIDTNNIDPDKDAVPILAHNPDLNQKLTENSANFHRIKPQNLNNKYPLQAAKGPLPDNNVLREHLSLDSEVNYYMVALISAVSAAISVAILVIGVAWIQKRSKDAGEVEYPAYGVTGPLRDPSPTGDRKLAQSAQMYHYQHQKQQIIAMDKQKGGEGCNVSDVESDDDNEEGDYTVYECPGLAPTGEMEVKNPLFLDETPATPMNNLGTTQVTLQQPQLNNSGKTNAKTSSDKKTKKSKK